MGFIHAIHFNWLVLLPICRLSKKTKYILSKDGVQACLVLHVCAIACYCTFRKGRASATWEMYSGRWLVSRGEASWQDGTVWRPEHA